MPESVAILVVFDSRMGPVEQLAEEVASGARAVAGTNVVVRRADDVSRDDLLTCDGLAVGSPVQTGTVSTPIKHFFDRWRLEFDFYPDHPMEDCVGAAFAAGGQGADGCEMTLITILSAMLHNRMIVVSGGGALGASASTETKTDPLDAAELAEARGLGSRLAETAHLLRRGRGNPLVLKMLP